LGILALALILAFVLTRSTREASLIFRGIESGHTALFEITNLTERTVIYVVQSMKLTSNGWEREPEIQSPLFRNPRSRAWTLAPSECQTFGMSAYDTPRKVVVTYWHDRNTNGLWRLIPQSFARRIPQLKNEHTFEGPVFSLKDPPVPR
jgi:hypothetical protein